MPEPPQTGLEAIEYALSQLTAEEINNRGKKILATGSRSKRSYGVKLLNIARGLERNNLKPSDYMISSVPVIPPKYRPFAAQGDTLIPGDANVLYKDLIDVRDAHDEEEKMFGKQNAGASRLALYDAVKSVYGYGEAVKPKTRAKGVEGFLKKITGSTSKFSYVQSKMMAKTQDNVGRSTTIVDPDLGIDEVGVPKDMAMTMYAPYVQRRLKGMGYKDAEALKAVKNRTDDAWRALQQECEVRPILYTRAPAWYRFNIVSGKVKLIDGSAIATNPIVQGSQSGDYDGDTVNLHVPASDEAVEEAWKLLLPSHDPFSDRDTDKIVLLPKQEQILGNYTAATSPNTATYDFDTEEEALKAIKQGQIPLSANVQIRGGVKMASQKENEEVMQVKGPVRDPKTGKWMPTKNKNETEVQPDVAPVEKKASTNQEQQLKAILSTQFGIDPNAITPATHLRNDLNADSLDEIEILQNMEDTFNNGTPYEEANVTKLKTYADLLNLIQANAAAQVEKTAAKRHWFDVWKSWDVTKRREVMKATLGEERIYNINFNAETPEELGPMARPVGSAMMMYRRHHED